MTAAQAPWSRRCARPPQPAHGRRRRAILGLLVVVQLRTQTGGIGAPGHVRPGADAPRREPEHRERPAPGRGRRRSRTSWPSSSADRAQRRDVGRPDRRPTSARIRAWAGLDPVAGRGVQITVSGEIDAGRPSTTSSTSCATPAPRRSRSRTSGSIAGTSSAACPGSLDRRRTPLLGDPFTIRAIGSAGHAGRLADPGRRDHRPARGDLSRRDGRRSTPVDQPMTLPATTRNLVPEPWPSAALIPSAE